MNIIKDALQRAKEARGEILDFMYKVIEQPRTEISKYAPKVATLTVPINKIGGTELEFVIMVIAVSCVKLLSAHNSTQHTSRKHKV
jgi:Polyribonucleotide nucleotidyltransferase (polynucleotide phosphorylase)